MRHRNNRAWIRSLPRRAAPTRACGLEAADARRVRDDSRSSICPSSRDDRADTTTRRHQARSTCRPGVRWHWSRSAATVSTSSLDRLDCLTDWDIVVTTRGSEAVTSPSGGIVREERCTERASIRDLVRAVDVVITKPGYGIIADCVANDDGDALHLPRTLRGIRRHGARDAALPAVPASRARRLRSRRVGMPRSADAYGTCHPHPRRSRPDGAAVAARMIAELVNAT